MLRKLLNLLTDVAVYGASSALSQLIGFLLLPLYTRFLTPTDYGVIAMLAIITTMFTSIGNMGLSNAVFRWFNRCESDDERRAVMGTALLTLFASAIALTSFCWAVADLLAEWVVGDATYGNMVRVSIVTTAITLPAAVPLAVLRSRRRVPLIAAFNISKLVLGVLLTIYLVVERGLGLWGVLWASLVVEVVGAIVLLWLTRTSYRLRIDRTILPQMMSYGLPLVPHHIQSTILLLFGQYMVAHLLGVGEAGLYAVAAKFAFPIGFVVTAFQNAWEPYKFHVHKHDEDPPAFFSSVLTYYAAGVTYLWLGVAVWGPEMIRLMTAPAFHSAAALISSVALVRVGQGIYYMSATGLELTDSMRRVPLVSFAGLLAAVAGAFVLVPLLGADGAALSTALSYLVMSVALYMLARKYPIPYDWSTISGIVLLAVAFAAVSYLAQSWPVVPRIAYAAAVSLAYPLIVFMILLRSRDERQRMHTLVRRMLSKFRPSPSGT